MRGSGRTHREMITMEGEGRWEREGMREGEGVGEGEGDDSK